MAIGHCGDDGVNIDWELGVKKAPVVQLLVLVANKVKSKSPEGLAISNIWVSVIG